jgi:MOSC domain-containing protein YiiM
MGKRKAALEPLALPILSVNVARPALLGMRGATPVMSGIRKRPVRETEIKLDTCNLEGDGQADLVNHGGADKAVYGYPAAHWSYWRAEHGLSCGAGTFGENLTLDGAGEDEVRIGDVYAWGDARLEVSQPRAPCYKLSMHLGRDDIAPAMVKTGRCGWYFRVLEGATVPCAKAALVRIGGDAAAPTVAEAFRAHFSPRASSEELQRLASCPALADDWRAGFAQRLAKGR